MSDEERFEKWWAVQSAFSYEAGDGEMREDAYAAAGAAWGACVKSALARLDRALALLREVEWAGDGSTCPSCGKYDDYMTPKSGDPDFGHAPDCKLKALLEGTE